MKKISKILSDTSLELPGVVREYAYSIEEAELIITKGKDGIILNDEKMTKEIKESITNVSQAFPKERTIDIRKNKSKRNWYRWYL